MWYFAWILGVTMAVLLAIVNTTVCDAQACAAAEKSPAGDKS